MEIKKTEKQLKEVEIAIERYTECDKCKSRIRTNSYNAFDCTLNITTGEAYPEYSSICERTVDLCESCSEGLVDLLIENGYRINSREIEG